MTIDRNRRPHRRHWGWTTASLALATASVAQGQTTPVGTVNTITTSNTTVVGGVTVQPDTPSFTTSTTTAANDTVTIGLRGRNTLIDWQDFSVAHGQIATFTTGALPVDAPRAVLNRVTSGTPTTLAGALNATDGIQVWVVNTAGILVGPGAAINTGGLVLSTLNLADDGAFLTGGETSGAAADRYSVRFVGTSANGAIGAAPDASVTGIAQINTNNGLLALVAPAVNLAADLRSGTGATAFALATDVTMATTIGGPLSLTLNAGTRIGSSVEGTVIGDRVYALVKPEDGYNVLLSMPAAVSNATVDARGVVVLGTDASASVALPAGGADVATISAAVNPTGIAAVTLGGIAAVEAAATGASVRVDAGGAVALAGAIAAGNAVSIGAGGGLSLGAGITAGTGDVTLAGATTLTADAVLTSVGGGLTLGGPVSGGFALTLTAPGAKLIGGAIGGTTAVTALSALTSNGGGQTVFQPAAGSVLTNGDQSYQSVVLGADTSFAGANGTFGTIGSTSSTAHALTLSFGTATTLAAVGGVTTLTAGGGGTTTLGGDVATTGAQTYSDGVTLATDVALSAGGGAVTFAAALAGGHALTIDTGGVTTLNAVGQGGASNALVSLSTSARGTTIAQGAVTTSGDQTYAGATLLAGGGTQALTSTGGGIAFDGTLDAAAAGAAASLGAATTIAFNGATGSTTPFAALSTGATGSTAINADITGGAITFGNQVTLSGTRTLSGGVTFIDSVGGPGGLILAGAGTKIASRGLGVGSGVSPLAGLTLAAGAGALSATGDIATTGAQRYQAALYLGDQAPHAAHTTTLSGSDLSFAAATPSVFGADGETLALRFTGTATLSGAALSGFTGLIVGPAGGTAGATTLLTGTFALGGDATFNDATTLSGDTVVRSNGGGTIAIAGALGGAGAGGQALALETAGTTILSGPVASSIDRLTTDAPGGTTLSGTVAAATQIFGDAVTIAGSATLTAANALRFDGALGGDALTLAGAGTKSFAAAGGVVMLASLADSGGTLTIGGGGVTTTGLQSYSGSVVLTTATMLRGAAGVIAAPLAAGGNDLTLDFAAPLTLDGALVGGVRTLAVTGPVTLSNTLTTTGSQTFAGAVTVGSADTGLVAGANPITFQGAIDALDGTQALTVRSGGAITVAAAVGAAQPLAALTTTGGGALFLNTAAITTLGAQRFGGPVVLGTDATFTGSGVVFGGGVVGNSGGRDHDLTLVTSGDDAIDGAALTGIRTLSIGGGGTIALGGAITTSGAQRYADPVVLAAAATLTTGAAIAFGGSIDGNQALTVASGGATTVAGAIGTGTALASLDLTAGGGIALSGGATTQGAQTYRSAVTLGLTGTSTFRSLTDQAIGFGGSVDGQVAGAQGLATATAGLTSFTGAVGARVPLAGVTTAGPVRIAAPTITTTGDQRYGGPVTLASDTVLSGATPVFGGGVFGAGHDLSLAFAGTIAITGGFTGIRTLSVVGTGTTTLSGTIVTGGSQRYAQPVLLVGATTLATTGGVGAGDIAFGGTIDGGFGLSVQAGGLIGFGGTVGGGAAGPLTLLATAGGGTTAIGADIAAATQRYQEAVTISGDRMLTADTALNFGAAVAGPGMLTLAGTGARMLGGAVSLGGFVDAAGGVLSIAGGGVTTAAGQRYDGDVLLAAATALVSSGGGALTLNGRTDGAQALRLDTAGTTMLTGPIGSVVPLASIATDAAGSTILAGGSIAAGVQTYGDPVTLTADMRLTGADTVAFGGSVDGARLLSITSRGATRFGGGVGGTTALTGLALRSGSVTLGTGNRVGTLAAAVAGGLSYDDAGALTIGTVDGLAGIATGTAPTTITAGGVLTLAANVRAGGVALAGVGIGQAGSTVVDGGTGSIALDGRGGTVSLAGSLVTTNGGARAVSVAGAGAVALGTVSTGGGGTLALGGTGSAAITGSVTQAAGTTIAAGTLTGAAGGAVTLTNVGNLIGIVGPLAANGIAVRDGSAGLILAGPIDAGTGGFAVTQDAGTLTLAGALRAAQGVVSLTGGGSIVQTGGAIVADTLTGSSVGATALTASGNQIGRLAGFTTTGGGGFTLNDASRLSVSGDVQAAGDLALTTVGLDAAGRTIGAGGAVAINGGSSSIAVGTLVAGTSLSVTSGADLSVAAARAGGDVTIDAGGIATLGPVSAGSGGAITLRATDAAIGGTLSAARVGIVNRAAGTATLRLGDATQDNGFRLSQDEIGRIQAATLVFDGGAGNVEIGKLALTAAAGSTALSVLATGRIDVDGAVSGSGVARQIQIGGSATGDGDRAGVIAVTATAAGGGGSLSFDGADLDLRGDRIGVGQAAGFLTPLGLLGGTRVPVATVASAFAANANSALYNASIGGSAYAASAPVLLQARSLTVRYGDYALIQNTGAAGASAGVVLGAAGAAGTTPALSIRGGGGANAFALFGVINGAGGTAAALLGERVIAVDGATLVNTRINGCLVGSGTGCLSSTVAQPVLNIFDASRLNIFRSADDLALPFDPVVGSNNEALFSGIDVSDVAAVPTDCTGTDDPACRAKPAVAPPAPATPKEPAK